MSKKKKTKKGALKSHSQKRYSERYDLEIDQDFYKRIIESIQGKNKKIKTTVIEKQSRVRTVFKIEFNNKVFFVIYNNKFKELQTFLSLEQAKKNNWTC